MHRHFEGILHIACRGAGARSAPGAVGSTAHHGWQFLQKQHKRCVLQNRNTKRLPCEAPGKLGLIRDTTSPPKRSPRRFVHHDQIQSQHTRACCRSNRKFDVPLLGLLELQIPQACHSWCRHCGRLCLRLKYAQHAKWDTLLASHPASASASSVTGLADPL